MGQLEGVPAGSVLQRERILLRRLLGKRSIQKRGIGPPAVVLVRFCLSVGRGRAMRDLAWVKLARRWTQRPVSES